MYHSNGQASGKCVSKSARSEGPRAELEGTHFDIVQSQCSVSGIKNFTSFFFIFLF